MGRVSHYPQAFQLLHVCMHLIHSFLYSTALHVVVFFLSPTFIALYSLSTLPLLKALRYKDRERQTEMQRVSTSASQRNNREGERKCGEQERKELICTGADNVYGLYERGKVPITVAAPFCPWGFEGKAIFLHTRIAFFCCLSSVSSLNRIVQTFQH